MSADNEPLPPEAEPTPPKSKWEKQAEDYRNAQQTKKPSPELIRAYGNDEQ